MTVNWVRRHFNIEPSFARAGLRLRALRTSHAGDSHTLIRMTDGSLRAVGYDVDGALGIRPRLIPFEFRSGSLRLSRSLDPL